MKQYVIDYAHDQIKSAENCKLMQRYVREEYISSIRQTLRTYERGLITTDEAIQLIARPLN